MPRIVKFEDEELPSSASAPVDRAEIDRQRKVLPMFRAREQVLAEVRGARVSVIVGETGSGKSTQLPQALIATDPKENVAVTQPRRVAAVSLAKRVAAEMGCAVGSKVGYNVRFDAKVSPQTRLRYLTDGMLLRECMLDPKLKRYTTVIVDEAHERTLTSDLALGLLRALLLASSDQRRPLRVVVMSATLDAQRFVEFFRPLETAQLYVPGRAFPVERFFTKKPVANIVDGVVQTVEQINSGEPAGGDILAFLPGMDEIEEAAEQLRQHTPPKGAPKLIVAPLYASLPETEQQKAFARVRKGERKVVLATNIAETSVTISGVSYVVDSGVRKVRMHRQALGLESLLPAPISQAGAAQRMGRAGRERAGKCWRLYTEDFYRKEMLPQTEAEISRVSLALPVLMLKRIGVKDVVNFSWVDRPTPVALRNALLQLYTLRALNAKGDITPRGREMAALPLPPQLAAVLVSSKTDHREGNLSTLVYESVLDVAACLSVQDLLATPGPAHRDDVKAKRQELFPAAAQFGDLVLLKLVWDAYREEVAAGASHSDLKEWCFNIGVSLRGLRKVAQVRRQLVAYLKDDDKALNKNRKNKNSSSSSSSSSDSDSDSEDENENLGVEEWEQLIKAFLAGYVTNTAIALPDRRFQTVATQQPVSVHPGSTLFGARPEAIMYLEHVYTARGYARLVSPIRVEWLRELAPHLLARKASDS